jgi:hypothetical protein
MAPHEVVSLLLRGAGSHFHPVLARLFVSEIGFYPVGTMIETNRGELAIVTEINHQHPRNPIVKLVNTPEESTATTIDTAEQDEDGNYLRTVARVMSG